jgi:hypothetical protein
MFHRITAGLRGVERINRRQFLYTGFGLFGVGSLLAFLRLPQFSLRSDFYQKALARRDLNSGPITVYKMVPLPGIKYGNAERRHMANKIFANIEAARAHRPHRGFLYGLKPIPLPAALVNGMDQCTLFYSRKDFDQRVRTDQRHWQRLGIGVNAVFDTVKNA